MRDRKARSVLLSTLPLADGGVAAHAGFVARALARHGYTVTLAYYQPFSSLPELSVPCWRLGRGRVASRTFHEGDLAVHEIGSWLPELEFTHYLPTRPWRRLLDSHEAYVAVSGNALPAAPFALTRRPYVAWVGTPYHEDRRHRVAAFPWFRRGLDRLLNSRVCSALEKRVLRSGLIVPTTPYVRIELMRISGASVSSPLGIPVDTSFFTPDPGAVQPFRVLFAGRINDPRKAVPRLIDAVRLCRGRGYPAVLELAGAVPGPALTDSIARSGIGEHITGLRKLSREELREAYRRCDVFVVPSHQEGLCISALEAMACGCPVVSTRCGGPEAFLDPGFNGLLAGHSGAALADAILTLACDRAGRDRMAARARAVVEADYSETPIERAFLSVFRSTFPG
jgi:glycosyltransferase involved in cell wall biosynthesis